MSANNANEGGTLNQARGAKPAALIAFQHLGKVAGIGITRIGNGYGLKVNLQEMPSAEVVLPKSIQGIPVRIEVVGPLKKRLAV